MKTEYSIIECRQSKEAQKILNNYWGYQLYMRNAYTIDRYKLKSPDFKDTLFIEGSLRCHGCGKYSKFKFRINNTHTKFTPNTTTLNCKDFPTHCPSSVNAQCFWYKKRVYLFLSLHLEPTKGKMFEYPVLNDAKAVLTDNYNLIDIEEGYPDIKIMKYT